MAIPHSHLYRYCTSTPFSLLTFFILSRSRLSFMKLLLRSMEKAPSVFLRGRVYSSTLLTRFILPHREQ